MGSAGNGPFDYYKDGDWNAICSMCGHKFKASMLRKHWQGQWRCRKCWEIRQPQDFVRGIPDNPNPPWTQPDLSNEGDFISTCTFPGRIALPSLAVAGCVIPGYVPPNVNQYLPSIPVAIPVPAIILPLDGDTVSGVSVTIQVNSTNLGSIDYGAIYIDGVIYFGGVTNGSISWNTTTYADGPHTITFTVLDLLGTPHSASVAVTVSNTGPLVSSSFYSITV